jgi:carbonic anhydrase/acetyltransferase-like protein (isoleucine patch superfamily)
MLLPFGGRMPQLGAGVFIAEGAQVIGDVTLGAGSSVWFNSVLRGDVGPIRIGAGTNLQDLSMVHVTAGQGPCVVGDHVTVGHSVVLHGCTVGDLSLIGIGSIVLDGAEIGSGSMIGAGSLVTPRTKIPPGVLALGSPCRVVRPLTEAERAGLRESARHYVEGAARYREGR